MKKPKIHVVCKVCGKEEEVSSSRAKRYSTCSVECMSKLYKAPPNVTCCICGKEFHLKKNYIDKSKTHEFCCSKECDREHRKSMMKGKRNHQYGLLGDKNSSFKNYEMISNYGYILVSAPDHPFRNSSNRVFQHRLVAEQYLLTEENSIEVSGKRYLKPEFDVHHVDENKQNNIPSNLIVLTKSEHMSLHAQQRNQIRESNGKIYAYS